MLREIPRFFTAVLIKESQAAVFTGHKISSLQSRLSDNEKYFSDFIARRHMSLPDETLALTAAAKENLAAAQTLIAQASTSKFVRCWRLLAAYDLAVAGENKQNRSFWTCFIFDRDSMER